MSLLVEPPACSPGPGPWAGAASRHLGVAPAGFMTRFRHRLANLLVGNPDRARHPARSPWPAPASGLETDALIALGGADRGPTIEEKPVRLWRPTLVRAGTRLAFGAPRQGCRCYLALAGGFRLPRVMDSARAGPLPRSPPASAASRPALKRGAGWTACPAPATRYRPCGSASTGTPAVPGPGLVPAWTGSWFPPPRPAPDSGPQWPALTAEAPGPCWRTAPGGSNSTAWASAARPQTGPGTPHGDALRGGGHWHPPTAPRRLTITAHGRTGRPPRLPAAGANWPGWTWPRPPAVRLRPRSRSPPSPLKRPRTSPGPRGPVPRPGRGPGRTAIPLKGKRHDPAIDLNSRHGRKFRVHRHMGQDEALLEWSPAPTSPAAATRAIPRP